MDDEQDRIQRKAHELWEAEGRPEGRADRHWEDAKEILAIKESIGSTLRPVADTVDEPVEPTSALEVQGDVPGLTDLGDVTTAPSRASEAGLASEESAGAAGTDKPKRPSARTPQSAKKNAS